MSDDVVSLSGLPEQLNTYLGMGSGSIGGSILATLIVMCLFMVPALYFTKGRNMLLMVIIGYSSLVLGVAVFALPSWILVIVAILSAGLLSGTLRDWITGRYGG